MVLQNVPIPLSDAIAQPKRTQYGRGVDPQEGKITQPWVDYFTQQGSVLSLSAPRVASIGLNTQGGSISPTDMTDGSLPSGLFQFWYYLRITRAATVSSSVSVTVDWQDGGVAVQFADIAITGNTVSTIYGNGMLFRADAVSPIRYSTTYASVGATSMQYQLDIVLLQVDA